MRLACPKSPYWWPPFIVFEYDGLEQPPKIMADLTLMIRKSNNRAATRVVEKITLKRIQRILMMPFDKKQIMNKIRKSKPTTTWKCFSVRH